MPPIRTALIEDDAPFAETLARFFRLSDLIACEAIYPSAEAALAGLPALAPDVLLVDINLPRMNGIELVAKLKSEHPNVLCLILTMYEETALIFDALKAGACGYLLKRTPPAEIVTAIEQVYAGGSPMSPQIARQVVSFFHRTPMPTEAPAHALTEREADVLKLLSQGLLYKEIADQLCISLDTVRTHLRRVYEKLHVHSRTAAVVKYLAQRGG